MADDPAAPEEMVGLVKATIEWASPYHQITAASIVNETTLEGDCGLPGYARKALGGGFEKIARRWKAQARLNRGDCEDLVTAGDAIALVAKAAGFSYP